MFSAGVKEDDESSVGEKERKKASLTGARFAKPVMQPAPSRKRPALIKSAKPPSTAKLSSEVKRESLWKEKAMSAQVPPNRRDFTGFGHICEELLDGGSREGAGKVACKRRGGEGERAGGASGRHPARKGPPLPQASAPVRTRPTIPYMLVRRRGDRRIVIICRVSVGVHPARVAGPARERGLVHFSRRVRG